MSEEMTAAKVLETYQRQLDMDGCEVGVSRQAVEEVLAELSTLKDENQRLKGPCYHYDVPSYMQDECHCLKCQDDYLQHASTQIKALNLEVDKLREALANIEGEKG